MCACSPPSLVAALSMHPFHAPPQCTPSLHAARHRLHAQGPQHRCAGRLCLPVPAEHKVHPRAWLGVACWGSWGRPHAVVRACARAWLRPCPASTPVPPRRPPPKHTPPAVGAPRLPPRLPLRALVCAGAGGKRAARCVLGRRRAFGGWPACNHHAWGSVSGCTHPATKPATPPTCPPACLRPPAHQARRSRGTCM